MPPARRDRTAGRTSFLTAVTSFSLFAAKWLITVAFTSVPWTVRPESYWFTPTPMRLYVLPGYLLFVEGGTLLGQSV